MKVGLGLAGLALNRDNLRCYHEVFIDEGDTNIVRVLRLLHQNKFDGVIIPDHTPSLTCAAPWHAGMAFALGYIKAALTLIQQSHA